jgi:hypothetical protein
MLLRLLLLLMLWVITHAATVNKARSRIKILSIAVVNIPHPVHLITLFRGTVAGTFSVMILS